MEGWRRFLRSDPDSGAAPPGNEGYFESWTKQTSARSRHSSGRTGEPSNYPLVYHYSDPQMQIGIIFFIIIKEQQSVPECACFTHVPYTLSAMPTAHMPTWSMYLYEPDQ